MNFFWDEIYSISDLNMDFITERAMVFGGWLVRSRHWEKAERLECTSESMVFVPDPNHEWIITE